MACHVACMACHVAHCAVGAFAIRDCSCAAVQSLVAFHLFDQERHSTPMTLIAKASHALPYASQHYAKLPYCTEP